MEQGPSRVRSSILDVGIADVDEQHRALFDLLKLVKSAADAPEGAVRVRGMLEEHEACTQAHFEFEERLRRELAFPQVADNAAGHGQLLRELAEFRSRPDEALVAGDFPHFIQTSFINHLLVLDRLYAEILMAKETGTERP